MVDVLDLSNERDQWERFARSWARSEYRRGYADGHRHGYAAGYAQAVADWKVVAGVTVGGRSFAELDRARYPPDGRESWIIRSGENAAQQS